jgi:hypothetical protein
MRPLTLPIGVQMILDAPILAALRARRQETEAFRANFHPLFGVIAMRKPILSACTTIYRSGEPFDVVVDFTVFHRWPGSRETSWQPPEDVEYEFEFVSARMNDGNNDPSDPLTAAEITALADWPEPLHSAAFEVAERAHDDAMAERE